MGYAVETLAELQAEVFSVFPRTSGEAIVHFNNKVQNWTNNLCDFPYWFLRMSPSSTFQTQFPLPNLDPGLLTPLAGNWVAKGWLRPSPGVNRYKVYMPTVDDSESDPTYWAAAKVKNIGFCKEFHADGRFRNDLDFTSSDLSLSSFCLPSKHGPRNISLETTETGSYIILHPTPTTSDYPKLYAIQCVLSELPWYQLASDSSIRNRFLTYAPDAVLYKCLVEMARFFDESTMEQKFREELYGNPPKGEARSQFPYKGIMGKYWEQTRDMARQNEKAIPWYSSAAEAVGRSNRGRNSHWMGHGYYQFFP